MKQHTHAVAILALAVLIAACGSPPDQSPVVSLSTAQPAQDGRPLTLVATVSSPASTAITKVEFFRGQTRLGEDASSPYEFTLPLSVSADTTFEFSATATDEQNRTGRKSLSVPVTADTQAPTAGLSGSSSSFVTGGTLTLSATVNDNVGVQKVEFYRGTAKMGEDTEAPYSLEVPITSADNGSLEFSARAYDFKGLEASSAVFAVTVDIDEIPPTVSLSRSPGSLTAPGSITLSATASDNKGVAKVEFFNGTTLLGEDTSSPYSFNVTYSASYNNTDSFTARAVDIDGNTATSSAVTATIDIDITPPTVSLTASSASFTAPATLTLTATASDNRAVARVEFYRGSTLLVSDTTAPYSHSLSLTAPDNGNLSFSAIAFDARNNQGQDTETVSVAIPPSIAAFTPSVTSFTSDGGAFTLNFSAANFSALTLSANPTTGLTGLPSGPLAPSATSQSLSLSPNTTRFDRTYQLTLNAAGHGGVTSSTLTLSLTQTPAFSNISAGFYGTCALIGGQLHCWGGFPNVGATVPQASLVAQGAIPAGVSVAQLSVGYTACIIGSNNLAYCWGANLNGSAGDGTTNVRASPVAVSQGAIPAGVTLTRIATKTSHTCAIGSNGRVYCWGWNAFGQLGGGNLNDSSVPAGVSNSFFPTAARPLTDVTTGDAHSCALGSDGSAHCWGYNFAGQLGNNSTGNSTFATPVEQGARPAGVTYTKLSAGYSHTCALGSNGLIYCWGLGNAHQLGNASAQNRIVPVAVSSSGLPAGLTFTDVSAGNFHTCALGSNAQVYCWGTGFAAGASTSSTSITTPTALPNGTIPAGVTITQISSGADHACAIASDRRAYCWGSNTDSKLGRVSADTSAPGRVLSPTP